MCLCLRVVTHVYVCQGLGTSTAEEGKEYFSNLPLHRRSFSWEGGDDGDAIIKAFAKDKVWIGRACALTSGCWRTAAPALQRSFS
jgi:hypothetical protein